MTSNNMLRRTAHSSTRLPLNFLRSLFQHRRRNIERNGWHRGAPREDGQALVECAISFSVLLGFFFTFLETCLILYTYNMISETAREGTRYAALHGSTCVTATQSTCTASVSGIDTYISAIGWPNVGGGTMTPVASFPDGNESPGSRVQVTVNYVFPVTLPFVPTSFISMASTSQMKIIQ